MKKSLYYVDRNGNLAPGHFCFKQLIDGVEMYDRYFSELNSIDRANIFDHSVVFQFADYINLTDIRNEKQNLSRD